MDFSSQGGTLPLPDVTIPGLSSSGRISIPRVRISMDGRPLVQAISRGPIFTVASTSEPTLQVRPFPWSTESSFSSDMR